MKKNKTIPVIFLILTLLLTFSVFGNPMLRSDNPFNHPMANFLLPEDYAILNMQDPLQNTEEENKLFINEDLINSSPSEAPFSSSPKGRDVLVHMNRSGQVVFLRSYWDNGFKGIIYSYKNGKIRQVVKELSNKLELRGLNDKGDILIAHQNGFTHESWIENNGSLTLLNKNPYEHTLPYTINDSGECAGISGISKKDAYGVLWSEEKTIYLGGENSPQLYMPFQVTNNSNVISLSVIDKMIHSFVWKDGRVINLGSLGGYGAFAISANNRGQIVGASFLTKPEPGKMLNRRAFLWEDGRMVQIGPDHPEVVNSGTYQINEKGQVLGYFFEKGSYQRELFILDQGQTKIITPPKWADSINFPKMNNHGNMAGYYTKTLNSNIHIGLFYYHYKKDEFKDLGYLDVEKYSASQISAINDKEQIAGVSFGNQGFTTAAFLYEKGQFLNLSALADQLP